MTPSSSKPTPSLPASGVLRITGRDALAVLQNVSTQRFDDLARGQSRLALFCDFRGRLLHRVAATRTSEDALWLVREDAPGSILAEYLERQVFREDVHIEDLSSTWQVNSDPSGGDSESTIEVAASVLRIEFAGGPRYELSPIDGDSSVRGRDAASSGAEVRRIASGWARHGHEITEAFNPFEVNLGHAIHLDKGCFTGHETLMRLVTYRSVRRRLVRLEGQGAPVAPANVTREQKPIGRLTSVNLAGGEWTGLAVLKHEACTEGAEVEIEGAASVRVREVFTLRSPGGRALKL